MIGPFPSSTAARGSGGPAPAEVTGGPGGERGHCALEQEGLVSGCWAQN